MDSIPHPIIFEVLANIPLKPLIRLKCVNKFWNSLLSSQDFIYDRLQKASQNNPSLITTLVTFDYSVSHSEKTIIDFYTITNHTGPVSLYSVRLKQDTYRFLPSCNGLICFFGSFGGIHVCNPTMKTKVEIPYCKGARLLSCGFGFDPGTRGYKIIRSTQLISPDVEKKGKKNCIEVFTIGSGSWKRLDVEMGSGNGFLKGRSPIYSNGYFYWLSENDSTRVFIQSLEVGSEVFGEINVPEDVYGKDCVLVSLVELGGKLCVVDLDFESRRRMDIWVCEDGDAKKRKCNWVRKTILHPSEKVDRSRPVVARGGEILLNGCIGGLECLVWYDLERGVFRNFDSAANIRSRYFHVSSHVESLVSL